MNTTFSMSPLFRSSIGFDRFSDMFESAFRNESTVSYPPYNVEKQSDDNYRIVVASAGVNEGDLDIQVEKGVLTISSGRREPKADAVQYLHQGIAQRAFKLSFQLAEYIEVSGAALKNGLLSVELVRRVPEAAKPRRIAISGDGNGVPASNTVTLEQKAA